MVEEATKAGMHFTGKDDTGERMEITELPTDQHPFMFGVQFHPESIMTNTDVGLKMLSNAINRLRY